MVGVSSLAGSILDLKDTTMETTGHVLLFHGEFFSFVLKHISVV
jgi:hypothetical protein